MKKTTTLNVFATIAICLLFNGCKKEQAKQTEVEYKITPISNTITRIGYSGPAGNMVPNWIGKNLPTDPGK
jgi:hypothetical protein